MCVCRYDKPKMVNAPEGLNQIYFAENFYAENVC